MNIEELEERILSSITKPDKVNFIYDLLLAYGQPKASITRLQKGDYNLAKLSDTVLWKKKLYFRQVAEGDLHALIDNVQNNPDVTRHHPRFIVITDFKTLLAVDSKTGDTLDTPFLELHRHTDFFLPWAGMEKSQIQSESLADIKAAEKLARLYDMIVQDNEIKDEAARHTLNIFLSRLLFCFFAEDTGIFANDQFTNAVASHTTEDGSDLQAYLQKLFDVLNLNERADYPEYLKAFPYVNGGLFAEQSPVPIFSRKARKIIIECGSLDWKAINPDIFGSMIQAVVHNDQRGSLGMHYTSVVNIMKVIAPLFLNDLQAQLEQAGEDAKKLNKLLGRLYHLRIFDPACGSGNFLIIAYKELCKLEIEILQRLKTGQIFSRESSGFIRLSQFYGIEIDDFACQTAKLSLWLADHQMNQAFRAVFGDAKPTLPLQEGGQIVCGNATRLDWEEVCPKGEGAEIYILGNPPFVGKKEQTKEQKNDIQDLFENVKGLGVLDYVAAWYLKSSRFIQDTKYKVSFVSTNSISQGEQVGILWKELFQNYNIKIHFAYPTFIWSNQAKRNASVHVVIIGFANFDINDKFIYNNNLDKKVKNITPYLVEGNDLIIEKRRNHFDDDIPSISFGSIAIDNGYLILTNIEKKELIKKEPLSEKYLFSYGGGIEFIRGIKRWCLWLDNLIEEDLLLMPIVRKKIDDVRIFRKSSNRLATNKLSESPELFGENRQPKNNYILIPKVSSENREYIPIGFMNKSHIANGSSLTIDNATIDLFAILTSSMHMIWLKYTCGRMKSDYQYSSTIVYLITHETQNAPASLSKRPGIGGVLAAT